MIVAAKVKQNGEHNGCMHEILWGDSNHGRTVTSVRMEMLKLGGVEISFAFLLLAMYSSAAFATWGDFGNKVG